MGTGSSNGKIDRRVMKTRRAIRMAFEGLLIRYSLDKVTVSAIAREANIDRKTFYLHYTSIDDLVDREAEDLVERMMRALKDKDLDLADHPRLCIRTVLSELNAILEENLDFYQRIASGLSIDFILERVRRPTRRAILTLQPSLKLRDDRELDHLIRFYVAGTVSVYGAWLTSDRSIPIEEIADIVENILTSGGAIESFLR